jgi:hypothetical protein
MLDRTAASAVPAPPPRYSGSTEIPSSHRVAERDVRHADQCRVALVAETKQRIAPEADAVDT